jgi:hypothetical protein
LLQHRSRVRDFASDDEIRRDYYPESEQLMKKLTGANHVVIFDHTIRRRVPGQEDRRGDFRQPVARIHVDHTEASGPQRVRDLVPDQADALLRGRVQIINLWRPIRVPVFDAPLAVADAGSVAPDDLVASDLIYPDRRGEIYSVKFGPAHQWFYVSRMQPDEALLLKCYDSETDGRARFAPHTAFFDPTSPPGRAAAREHRVAHARVPRDVAAVARMSAATCGPAVAADTSPGCRHRPRAFGACPDGSSRLRLATTKKAGKRPAIRNLNCRLSRAAQSSR